MPGPVTVKVEGLAQMDAALGELKKSTAKGVLRRVGIKALQPFDARWRQLAPHLTGQLGESGGVGIKLTDRQKRLARQDEGPAFVTVYAGPNDPAAVQQEFGNANEPPQPFARPAWAATKDEALKIVATELWGEIEKTARRLAARALRVGK